MSLTRKDVPREWESRTGMLDLPWVRCCPDASPSSGTRGSRSAAMKDSPGASIITLSAVGLDSSFKRSATKTTPERKLQARSGGSAMNRSSSSGTLVPSRSAFLRRRTLLLTLGAILVVVSTYVVKDVKFFGSSTDLGTLDCLCSGGCDDPLIPGTQDTIAIQRQ